MDFTKIYYPEPLTLGDFKNQQPANKSEADMSSEYRAYLKHFQADLEERIRNGEKFYSAAEIAEKLIDLDDEEPEDASTAGFHVRNITEVPRAQVHAFIVDLTIEQIFKQC